MTTHTTDYNMFKKHNFNRPLVEANVLKIMRSINLRNLLEHRPILVDETLRIIDGQHRLEAARRLELPIYYMIQKDLTTKDMILLNDNSKSWSREDYLNYYCAEGNINYLKLKNFMVTNKLSLGTSLVVLGLKTHSKGEGRRENPYKNGSFIFPCELEEQEAYEVLRKSNEFIQYIDPKLEGVHLYIFGPHFRRALYLFFSIQSVDFEVFMKKVSYRMDLLRPCSRLVDFLRIFKTIYNWKNMNPISIDEEA